MTPNTPKGATTESVEPSAAFTPGPWVAALGEVPYEEFNGELTWTVDAPDNWGICTIDCPVSDREANARLIAAAPDLLEALQAVVRVADRNTVDFDLARAAIAKALGGQP